MCRTPASLAKLLLLITLLQFAACASTPQASAERDAEAKQFHTHPASAALYVFRPDGYAPDDESVLYVDDRLVGATLPRAFFRIDVRPGKRRLHGIAPDSGSIELELRPGEIYFVSLKVFGGNSYFALEDRATGREQLLGCCALLENWSPGQRPLLR
jgi:hypothetical protein